VIAAGVKLYGVDREGWGVGGVLGSAGLTTSSFSSLAVWQAGRSTAQSACFCLDVL
jgi:hypothetical protein